MNTRLLAGCLLVALCGVTQSAAAASIRCGNHLLHDAERRGPTKYEVLKKCGEPVERRGHTWIYKRGGRTKILQFNGNGVLTTIRDK